MKSRLKLKEIIPYFPEFREPEDWNQLKGMMVHHRVFGMLTGMHMCGNCESWHPIWSAVNGVPDYLSPPLVACESLGKFERYANDLIETHSSEFLRDVRFHFTELPQGNDWMTTLNSLVPPAPKIVFEMYTTLNTPSKGSKH